ncbi:MAG: putative metal-binding motif-containing protein, partial [Phycisphaerales bacterium]|nr:putative metal-binding motif-containing protein [Phycisphaerales bacterium]
NDCDYVTDCNDPDCQSRDFDGDGFVTAPCGPDCNDNAASISPGVPENCTDGLDNDCDGIYDCNDLGCHGLTACEACCGYLSIIDYGYCNTRPTGTCAGASPPESGRGAGTYCQGPVLCCGSFSNCFWDAACCGSSPGAGTSCAAIAGNETACADGRDNDCDNLFDCADPDCQFDVDGDGSLAPPCGNDCADANYCVIPGGAENCSDGIDNDCDGDIDCDDADCANDAGCSAPSDPQADTTGIDKSRFISFSIPSAPTAAVSATALRVKFTSLHNVPGGYTNGSNLPIPFTLFQGQSMWVGQPQSYTESNSDTTTFMASKLQCTPYYQDWSTIPLLHVTGEAILPNSSYDVEILAESCRDNEETCTAVSAPLTILTGGSGNVVLAPLTDTWSKVGNFNDIGALVAKYQSNPGAPIKARSKIGTTDKRGLISIGPPVGFTDIPVAVDAYRGKPYPYKPGKCSGAPATECKDDTECVGTGTCILCP